MSTYSTMDIDTPAPIKHSEGPVSLQVHPLALVHMSDQYTRITGGGSPLAKTDPVVGLLYGHWTTTKDTTSTAGTTTTILSIADAGDVPLDDGAELAATHVALHQAVYPRQQVVGWYRVVDGDGKNEPTQQDLQKTMALAQQYPEAKGFYLGILAVQQVQKDALPVGLYQLDPATGTYLVAAEDWKLTTAHAERVAVERVVREKTHTHGSTKVPHAVVVQATYEPLSTSLEALQERLTVLEQFLQDTIQQKIPLDPVLLRQVSSLLCRLGGEALPPNKQEAEFWLPLASMAVTVDAVQVYTDRFRSVQEASSSRGGGSRDIRRQH